MKTEDLYQGLRALSELAFPKRCATCGQFYRTAEEFIRQTQALRKSSGLKEDLDDDDQVIVALFRNCTCGSTLMDEFSNRRDLSRAGRLRREKFDELLGRLTSAGISKYLARQELLNVMRGKGSQILKIPPSPDPH